MRSDQGGWDTQFREEVYKVMKEGRTSECRLHTGGILLEKNKEAL